jgi:hypothetical protein
LEVVQFARELGALCVAGNHEDFILKWRARVLKGEATFNDVPSPSHRDTCLRLSSTEWQWIEQLPLWIDLPDDNVTVVHAGFVPGQPLSEQTRNDMTNMRNLLSDGTARSTVKEGVAWATVWPGPRHVVFGHDAKRELQQERFATGLDTGACYGKVLTALVVRDDGTKELLSVPSAKTYVDPAAKIKYDD